jgi:hypothetical protein
MNRFAITDMEKPAYEAIRVALTGLPEKSQYAVLRKIAHDMDREITKPGAVRAAAAAAGSGARAAVMTSEKSAGKASPKASKARKDQKEWDLWSATPGAVKLFAIQKGLKETIKGVGQSPDPALLEQLKAVSAEIRTRYGIFRP